MHHRIDVCNRDLFWFSFSALLQQSQIYLPDAQNTKDVTQLQKILNLIFCVTIDRPFKQNILNIVFKNRSYISTLENNKSTEHTSSVGHVLEGGLNGVFKEGWSPVSPLQFNCEPGIDRVLL